MEDAECEKLFLELMESEDEIRFDLFPGPTSDIYFTDDKIFAAVGNKDGSPSLKVFKMDDFKAVLHRHAVAFCKENGLYDLQELLHSDEYGDFACAVLEEIEAKNLNA